MVSSKYETPWHPMAVLEPQEREQRCRFQCLGTLVNQDRRELQSVELPPPGADASAANNFGRLQNLGCKECPAASTPQPWRTSERDRSPAGRGMRGLTPYLPESPLKRP